MKVTINRKNLAACIQSAARVIVPRTALPVLTCVLLKAEMQPDGTGHVSVTGSDLDRYLTLEAGAAVKKGGACAVSQKMLYAALRNMTSEEVTLSLDDKMVLTVIGGERVMKINTLKADEFPQQPKSPEEAVTVPPGMIGAALAQVLPFASDDATRLVICGVYLEFHEALKIMVGVATDGRRLGMVHIADLPRLAENIIVPTEVAKVLVAMDTDDATGETVVSCAVGETGLHVSGAGWSLAAKRYEGIYPNYRQVIPAACKVDVTTNRAELLGALAFAETATSEKHLAVALEAGKKEVVLRGNNPEQGEGTAALPRLGTCFDEVIVAYNPAFLRGALEFIGGEQVTLNMADNMAPCLMRSEGKTAVLMPMRVA